MYSKRQNIDRADRVTWASDPARWTAINPAVFAPLPAYGTRLRGICFTNNDGASSLVVEVLDNAACADLTYLLRLPASNALSRVIERLTHKARRAWECLSDLMRCLVAQITHASLRFTEHLVFSALKALISP